MIEKITLHTGSLISFRGRRRRFIPIRFQLIISRVSYCYMMAHYTEFITTLTPSSSRLWRTWIFFRHRDSHSLQRRAHSRLFFCRCFSLYMFFVEGLPMLPSIFMDKMHTNDRNKHKKEPHDA